MEQQQGCVCSARRFAHGKKKNAWEGGVGRKQQGEHHGAGGARSALGHGVVGGRAAGWALGMSTGSSEQPFN